MLFVLPGNQLWNANIIEQEAYHQDIRNEMRRHELEATHRDTLELMASLTAVDGAVVLTDRLRLLGFGAEVIAQSPSLSMIAIASDSAASQVEVASIDSYGTRHRSAFRFCSSFEDAVAFVVSQDGGAKAVKRVGPRVVVWPDVDITT